jgi:5-formyltetrahydrofolate cyclo-ligase
VEKKRIRERVWKLLEERGVARFPKPVYGRIPNFEGAEAAAELLRRSEEYLHAEVVKVNPDAPQRAVRRAVLTDGRVFSNAHSPNCKGVPSTRPIQNTAKGLRRSIDYKGCLQLRRANSSTESTGHRPDCSGERCCNSRWMEGGKGEGFSELEYAILKSYGKCNDLTPRSKQTVHDLQLVEKIPAEPYDLPVNKIYTNTRVIKCPPQPRPHGIIWGLLEEEKVASIPLLRELRSMSSQSRS